MSRAGIALIAALSLLALLGLLIAGAVASTAMAQRSARLAVTDGVTTSAADYALASVLANPSAYGLADLPLGRSASFDIPPMSSTPGVATASITAWATRLANGVVWLVADAAVGGVDQGHRRIGLVARFPSPGPLPAAGVTARGTVSLGDVQLSADSAGDADCARAPAAAWVLSTDSTAYYLTPAQAALLDSAAGVRHVRGDTTIDGGSFTGVLIVHGGLTITGNWSGTGLILVYGTVRATGSMTVTGALMSFGGGTSVDMASGTIRYAPCVVAREIRAAIPPRTVRGRAWAELF